MEENETEGIACAELAEIYLLQGELPRADEMCRRARSLLPELHLYKAKLNRTLAGVAKERGHENDAIRQLRKAADGFKRLDEIGEWDETMFELAGLYRGQGEFERVADVLEEMRAVVRQSLVKKGIALI